MNNGELPEGWASTTIDSTFQLSGGGTPDRGNSSYWGGKVPWLSSGDIKTHRISVGSEFITKQGLANSSAKLCPAGSVVLVVRSGILKHTLPVAVLEQPAAINQDLRCMDSGNVELNAWLALALRASAREILEQNREGTTVQSVKTETIRAFPLKVPPLAEQRRIVAKVEELLARVHVARERLAKVPKILKRFRQAVLAAACDGRLTADWREETLGSETAQDLVNRIATERQRREETLHRRRREDDEDSSSDAFAITWDIPAEWCWASLKDLLHYERSAAYGVLQPGSDVRGGVPFVRICDLANGTVQESNLKHIAASIDKQYPRTRLLGNEVLVTLVGTIGRTAVVHSALSGANVARAIGVLPLCPHVIPTYVRFALDHLPKNKELNDLAREVARKTLNLGLLKAVQIPLPPLTEQHEIVRRVDALFALADKIEARVQAATARVAKITQAILAKAFRGELVPTEAELARAAGRDYEPAAALLKRIRAASATSAKTTRKGKHVKA